MKGEELQRHLLYVNIDVVQAGILLEDRASQTNTLTWNSLSPWGLQNTGTELFVDGGCEQV